MVIGGTVQRKPHTAARPKAAARAAPSAAAERRAAWAWCSAAAAQHTARLKMGPKVKVAAKRAGPKMTRKPLQPRRHDSSTVPHESRAPSRGAEAPLP